MPQLLSENEVSIRINSCATSMQNTKNFCYERKPSLLESKDECHIKEDTGKSKKNALYVLWHAKRHLSG